MKQSTTLTNKLLEKGLVSKERLDTALLEAKKSAVDIGDYLTRHGDVSEQVLVELLAEVTHVDRYAADRYAIDISLATLIRAETAQRYRVVPLQKKGGLLTVAMSNPGDLTALDAVEQIVQVEVDPVACTQTEFEQLFCAVYGKNYAAEGDLDDVEDLEYSQDEGEGEEEVASASLVELAKDAPVVRFVNWMIVRAVRERASDLHISPEMNSVQLRFRIDGHLKDQPSPPKSMLLHIISRIKILANLDITATRVPQDGRFTLKVDRREVHVRVSTIPTVNGENVVLRLLDTSASNRTLNSMGMSAMDQAKVEAAISKPYGMILATGPTGSGKTSSLYAMLGSLNRPDVNIMTVEDPVEYRLPRIRQVQLNDRAGMTFASGLRAILRQDPDIVMVGEIRDAETARIAVQAALTGHLVLSTVHTNNAAGAITRLIDIGIDPLLVSSVLLMAIAQRLVRVPCPSCSTSYVPHPDVRAFWRLPEEGEVMVKKAVGCEVCGFSGYSGRTGVFEVLEIRDEIKSAIMDRAPDHIITRIAQEKGGLSTLQEAAAKKIMAGELTPEEAMIKVGM